jgi:sugar lactone lactonase YvrE
MIRLLSFRPLAVLALVAALAVPSGASATTWTKSLVLAPAPIPGANGLAIGPDGALYVGSAGVGIFKLDKETGAIQGFFGAGGAWGADDLTFGPDGAIYHTAIMNGTVGRIGPDGVNTVLNTQPMPGVNPIAFSDDGRLFVGTAFMGDALYEFDPTGTKEPRLIAEGLGLNGFDWSGGVLWAPRMYTGELITIDVDTGATTTIADGFTFPTAADVRADGKVVVTDGGADQVWLVDPVSGSKSTMTTDPLPANLDNAAIDADGRLFISNSNDGSVSEVLPSGDVRQVSGGGLVTGGAGIACTQESGKDLIRVSDLWSITTVWPDGSFGPVVSPGGVPKPGWVGEPVTVAPYRDTLVLTSWFGRNVSTLDAENNTAWSYPYDPASGVVPIDAIGFGDRIVVAELGPDGGRLVILDPATNTATPLATMGVPAGLASDGTDLYASDFAAGTIGRIIEDGARVTPAVVAAGLSGPEGLALLPDGRLVVAETGSGRLTIVDPATGATSLLADGLTYSTNGGAGSPPTVFLSGVAVSSDGSVWVTANGLYRFTPASAA